MAKSGEEGAPMDGLSSSIVSSGGFSPREEEGGGGGGAKAVRGIAVKALIFLGGAYLVRKLTKRTTRWDHAKRVMDLFCGEKFSTDQAAKDPLQYFNIRLNACPAGELPDGSRLIYSEQAFWRTPERPYRQRFLKVKPCPKDMNCDVEMASYAVKDVEQFRNFCDREVQDRPGVEDVAENISEHLFTVHLNQCERGRKCLYEGSTPPGGFPQNYSGATYSSCEVSLFRSGEIHQWDRGFNEKDVQVFGPTTGPYEFKAKSFFNASGALSDLLSSGRSLNSKEADAAGQAAVEPS